jgi:phosphoribosylformylglycinamidine cyclo-ligase
MVRDEDLITPDRVGAGDVVVAMASSGLHSNGFSLARHVLLSTAKIPLDSSADLGSPLGEVLLTPTRIYAKDCLSLAAAVQVHAFSHVTGGGLTANLARVLPDGLRSEIDRSSWTPAPIFDLIAERGQVAPEEMERTFNLGVGMVAVVAAANAQSAVDHLVGRGVDAWVCGQISRA